MDKARVERLIKRQQELDTANQGWRDYWQDVADYCLSRKGWQSSPRNGADRLKTNNLYDSTAQRALQMMAAGFHSNLTNPSSLWFTMELRNKEFMRIKQIQIWFRQVNEIMFSALSGSNFDTTIDEFYTDCGAMGTGVILVEDDVSDKVRFTEVPPTQAQFEEDAAGRVNRFYRVYEYTVQQAWDKWGINAGPAVIERIDSKPREKVKILHYVGPRDKRDPSKNDNLSMPYESLWIELSKRHLIGESGFFEFPFMVGRFYKHAGDVFGFSPAMQVLSDIKLVNQMQRTMLRAAMKVSDPPLILPRRGFIMPLSFNPAAINYRDEKTKEGLIDTLPVSSGIPITRELIQDVQLAIEKGFFLPLFRAISEVTKQMTVPEVQRRIAENMVLLGPVIGRFTDEVLDPLLLRVFYLLFRNGEFPDVPEAIYAGDGELDVVYTSSLARVQRESEIFQMESFLNDVGLVAQAMPTVLDKVNGDAFIDAIARIKAIDPALIRDGRVVAEIRRLRAEQQQMVAQLEMAQSASQVAKTAQETAAAGKENNAD